MKSFILLALLVAAAVAVPLGGDRDATIVKYDNDNIGTDGYNYNYQTSDGKSAAETAVLKNVGTENEALEVRGQFSYTAPDGQVITVTYVADENGYQPQGAHIPRR